MTINIAGVPEHFNLPWHLAIEEGLFAEKGIDLQWTDYSGGTGAMCKALRSGKTDLAVLLTEGIITDIVKGNPSRIIHSYVSSPLIWGIFVPADSPYQTLADTKGKTYAISRMRSGSHLMAYVDYQQRNWNTDSLKFEVVGGLKGAVKAFEEGTAEVFMWEKFTTKPYVDSGQFRMVDVCITPWSCFVIACRTPLLYEKTKVIQQILTIIKQRATVFQQQNDAVDLVAKRYGLQYNDAQAWFTDMEWSSDNALNPSILHKVQSTLKSLDRINQIRPSTTLFYPL